jgi:hypothetical protein
MDGLGCMMYAVDGIWLAATERLWGTFAQGYLLSKVGEDNAGFILKSRHPPP